MTDLRTRIAGAIRAAEQDRDTETDKGVRRDLNFRIAGMKEVRDLVLAALPDSGQRERWKPIEAAKTDGTEYIVWLSAKHDMPGFVTRCAYHPDAGWCADELRDVTHWLC